MTSLPPNPRTETTRLIVEAVVDVLAIAGLVALAWTKSELAGAVIPIIAVIAGARMGSGSKGRDSAGALPPSSGAAVLLFAMAPSMLTLARRFLAVLVLGVLLSGCGGTTVPAGAAYRTAVHVARAFCQAVSLLPEPTTPTAGGEATP